MNLGFTLRLPASLLRSFDAGMMPEHRANVKSRKPGAQAGALKSGRRGSDDSASGQGCERGCGRTAKGTWSSACPSTRPSTM
jgi:hypothetical protein